MHPDRLGREEIGLKDRIKLGVVPVPVTPDFLACRAVERDVVGVRQSSEQEVGLSPEFIR